MTSSAGNHVLIKWGWGGHEVFLDLCELQVDRGDGKAFVLLTYDTTPGYTDTQPFPAVPAKWTYRAIYRVGDSQVGQWSSPVSVTVGGGRILDCGRRKLPAALDQAPTVANATNLCKSNQQSLFAWLQVAQGATTKVEDKHEKNHPHLLNHGGVLRVIVLHFKLPGAGPAVQPNY